MKNLGFLFRIEVWSILSQLKWGVRFEADLENAFNSCKDPHATFEKIVNQLIDVGIAFRYRGDQGSPYFSLTPEGQFIVDHLFEVKRILESMETTN